MPNNKVQIFAVLLALASFLLSGYTLWNQKQLSIRNIETTASPTPQPSLAPTVTISPSTSGSAQLSALQEKTAQLEDRLEVLESKKVPNTLPSKNGVRETVLYMGTGSSTNRDWTDIDAAGITLNTSSYGTIKEVRFEAALSIISGEAQARLKNKTTGAVYYDSTVMHNKSSSEWRTSSPIYLPAGNNEYVVELRSSNNERAQLDGSRLKILVE